MPTKAQLEAQKLYANLLEEIKLRIASINHCTLGQSGLAAPFVKDFCYLQIRMICELVALGCLVAHGDIKEASSKNMQGAWSAEKIMSTLERCIPTFIRFQSSKPKHLTDSIFRVSRRHFQRMSF
jgi:hypothetical protein